jgi:hypothetical protein
LCSAPISCLLFVHPPVLQRLCSHTTSTETAEFQVKFSHSVLNMIYKI